MRRFERSFNLTKHTRVLDVGGYWFNWSLLTETPFLTICNLAPIKGEKFEGLVADGRYLPFKNNAFDIVYSNSVIEHVGGGEDQEAFAKECRRVGQRYYIQTPNRGFPIEPHLLAPFVHFLSKPMQKKLLRNFTVYGWITRPTKQEADNFVESIRSLNVRQLQQLFPEAEIWRERVLGFTKSLIAVKL
jgi:ubiquinone/menaquinone biosynthesis C-methylase UbiE